MSNKNKKNLKIKTDEHGTVMYWSEPEPKTFKQSAPLYLHPNQTVILKATGQEAVVAHVVEGAVLVKVPHPAVSEAVMYVENHDIIPKYRKTNSMTDEEVVELACIAKGLGVGHWYEVKPEHIVRLPNGAIRVKFEDPIPIGEDMADFCYIQPDCTVRILGKEYNTLDYTEEAKYCDNKSAFYWFLVNDFDVMEWEYHRRNK